jgi:TrmH family RNA methyltransferase
MISSVSNPKIRAIKALQGRARNRREAQAFIVEGVRLAEEALASGWVVNQALYTSDLDSRGRLVVENLRKSNVAIEEVSERVMEAISDTKTPQGLLLELKQQSLPAAANPSLVLILDGVADPGNLGTLLRSAAAAGADAVVLAPGCAEAFSPKVLRSGMGAHFRLPILQLGWKEIASFAATNGLAVYVAQANAGVAYDQVDLTRPVALVIGGEAHGISAAASQLQAKALHIPMPGKMESLNAATAGSLLLFEAVRQRRKNST